MQYARVDEALVDNAAVLNQLGTEEVNPLPFGRVSYLPFVSTVAAEELSIGGNIEVDRPLVALQVVLRPFTGLDVIAGQPEVFPARGLQIVKQNLAVGVPKLMPEDFHRHGSGVDFGDVAAICPHGPDAIDFVPGTFVAEHEQRRIGGGELQVVQPVRALEDCLHFAGFGVHREQGHGEVRRQTLLHHLAFVPRLIELLRPWGPGAVIVPPVALDESTCEQGLVRVDGGYRAARRKPGDFARRAGIDVGCVDGAFFGVVNALRLSAGDDDPDLALHDRFGRVGFQIEHGNPIGRGVDHFLTVGCVPVLIEVEAGAARLAGEADDAVARVGIDPRGGWLAVRSCPHCDSNQHQSRAIAEHEDTLALL